VSLLDRINRIFRIWSKKYNEEVTQTFGNNTIDLFGFISPLKAGLLFLGFALAHLVSLPACQERARQTGESVVGSRKPRKQ